MKQKLGLIVLKYLRFWARVQLKKYAPDVVGITGSAGKTTTRNAVAAILQDKYRLKVSHKANSESGIPLNILEIVPHDYSWIDWMRMILLAPIKVLTIWKPYEKYLVEMGIDSPLPPKNMDYLLTIIQPRTAIFLNVLPVHTATFERVIKAASPKQHQVIIDAIATEKGKLIKQLPETGLAIVNADDGAVINQTKHLSAQLMTFGKKLDATVIIREIVRDEKTTRFTFQYNTVTANCQFPFLLADHYAYSFAAALCVALDEGYSLTEGCQLLQLNFKLPPGRMSLFAGINDALIIDSSYNASASPTIGALQLIKTIPAKRRLALLGDMRELGSETQLEHERVIDEALSLDQLILVGSLMKRYALPYAASHQVSVKWYRTAHEAGQALFHELKSGDVLLVKGSQNEIMLETAVEMLLKNPQQDRARLCRRGLYWDKRRALLK